MNDTNRNRISAASSSPSRRISNRSKRAAALAVASAGAVMALVDAQSALGVTKTFTATAAGASWTGPTNWSPNGVPAATDDSAIIDGGDLFLPGLPLGSQTLPIPQQIRTITYTGTSARRIGNSAAQNFALQLNGSSGNPLLAVTSTGSFTINGPDINALAGRLDLWLNANGDFNVANSASQLIISSSIFDLNGSRSINKTGPGTLVLSGTAAYTGGISIADGSVQLNTTSSANLALPNNISFSSNTGRLELGTGVTIGGLSSSSGGTVETTASSLLIVKNDDDNSFNGTLADGAGVLSLTKQGTGKLTLSGGSNFSGQIAVLAGTLFADHLGNTARKLGNGSNTLILQGGTIAMNGNGTSPGPDDVESFTSTALNGSQSVVQVTPGGNLTSMNLGTLTRGATATIDFQPLAAGAEIKASGIANDASGIIGCWATYRGNDWASINGANQFVPFTGYNPQDDPSQWTTPTDHISYGGTVGHVGASTTIGSLRMHALGVQPTLTVDPGATLTVGSGGLLVTSNAGVGTITGGGNLTSGTSELYVQVGGSALFIGSTITNNTAGAVTVISGGQGFYTPTGTNTYTGDTVINSGSITLNADSMLAPPALTDKGVAGPLGAGTNVQLNGGTLVLQAAFGLPQSTNRDFKISGTAGILVNGQLTLSGNISDPSIKGTLNVDGAGKLILTGSNSFQGGLRLNSGILSVTTGNALGANTGSILLNGGVLELNGNMDLSARVFKANRPSVEFSATPALNGVNSGGATINTAMTGPAAGWTLVKSGPGRIAFRGQFNTFTHLLVTGGEFAAFSDTNFGVVPSTPDPNNIELNGGTLRFYSNDPAGYAPNANRGITLDNGGGSLDYSQSSGTPSINFAITGAGALTKNGFDTVLVNSSHSFTGGLKIVEGRWNVQVNGAAGSGVITMSGGSPNASARDGSGAIAPTAQLGIGGTNVGANITLNNDIVLAPVGSGSNSFEVNNSTPTQNVLTLNGVISGTGGLTKGLVGGTSGVLVLGGSNTYSGTTNILLGTLRLGASGVIPDLSAGSIATGALLDVNGKTETIGSLLGGGTVDLGTGGALTVGADNTAATYSGALVGTGTVTKIGTGTQTFSGSNTYTGVTSVQAGNLTLNGALAQGRVVTGGGADIQGGRIVFSDTTNSTTIKSLLTTSYQTNGFNNATQIHSSTADTRHGLGFVDDGTKVTVAYTFYGDSNLDGTVNTGDFNALAANFNATGKSWVDGDFNYDGIVNMLDFNAVATNFAQSLPAGGLGQSLGTLVPEPAALGLASVALLSLRRRRHRKMQ